MPIPAAVAADVLFLADRTCCVCHESGKQVQIHHIDEDPSNNDPENLAVLCLECHAQTQFVGGFGRKLNAPLVHRYRSHWLALIQLRRNADALRNELNSSASRTAKEHAANVSVAASPASGTPYAAQTPRGTSPLSIDNPGAVGERFRTGGIVIAIVDVRSSDSVQLNKSTYRTDSEYAVLSDVPAGPGAKYITVQTRVLNDGNQSIDLTCGGPILTHVVDSHRRKYDTIDGLSYIPGNPECNANLQPGFENDMTWIYLVPAEAVIVAAEFTDYSDWSAPSPNPSVVNIEWLAPHPHEH